VMPCLEPVIMMLAGLDTVDESVTSGRRVEMPLMTPNRFTAIIDWKYSGSDQDPFRPIPALSASKLIFPVTKRLAKLY